jgi:hypothetical protein
VEAGDLVRHNRTKSIGVLLEVLDDPSVPAPNIYNVHWQSNPFNPVGSHFIEELEVINESR